MQNTATAMLLRNSAVYDKPDLETTGSGGGTISEIPAGYSVSGMDDAKFVWLDRPMLPDTGSHYWEVSLSAFPIYPGIIDDVVTPRSVGGYPTKGLGLEVDLSLGTTPWAEAAWGVTQSGAKIPNGSGTFGFIWNSNTSVLEIRRQNTNARFFTLATPPAAVYAHCGFDASGAAAIRLGVEGCLYPRPPSARYL